MYKANLNINNSNINKLQQTTMHVPKGIGTKPIPCNEGGPMPPSAAEEVEALQVAPAPTRAEWRRPRAESVEWRSPFSATMQSDSTL